MKKVIQLMFLVIVILLTVISIIIFVGVNDMKYNNTVDKTHVITKIYSTSKIKKLKEEVESGSISYEEFKLDFKVECLRKTYQGYYIVLLQSDGRNVFVFMDNMSQLNDVIVFDSFNSKEDFNVFITNQTAKGEVISFDPNAIYLPISSKDITAHIVKEGIVIVNYVRMVDGVLLKDPLVDTIEFIENKDIPALNNDLVSLNVPYILDVDKNVK